MFVVLIINYVLTINKFKDIMFTSENKYGIFILYGYNLFVVIILDLMFGSMFYNVVGIYNCLGK